MRGQSDSVCQVESVKVSVFQQLTASVVHPCIRMDAVDCKGAELVYASSQGSESLLHRLRRSAHRLNQARLVLDHI